VALRTHSMAKREIIFRAQRLRIAQFLGRLAMDKAGENTTTFGNLKLNLN